MNLEEWITLVDLYFRSLFAITLDDAGMERSDLLKAYEQGLAPNEYATWYGEKYDLTPLYDIFRSL